MRNASLLALALALAACSSPSATTNPPADGGGTDVVSAADVVAADVSSASDAAMPGDAVTADTSTGSDAGAPGCGTERPVITGIRGTEGLVIGADGTIYYSQGGAVGRLAPGGNPENRWVTLSGASTVWGLALDNTRRRLYAGSPATQSIFVVDLAADPPTATRFLGMAGQPNGLTMDPNGDLIYSDFGGGQVYRVNPMGMRTQVTTSRIASANGVAFGSDGSLYVDSYSAGTLVRLTLADGRESARETVATGLGAPDGLAFDAEGRIYIGDNRGRLVRLDADGSNPEVLGMNIANAANVAFGAGALPCTDIYVASGGTLFRYTMGTTAGAAVPWQR